MTDITKDHDSLDHVYGRIKDILTHVKLYHQDVTFVCADKRLITVVKTMGFPVLEV